ncbi:MAG TPA: hypothetical protein DCS93_25560 [Microscillaceae bacterium]|nr:hypothetical protein [Microscillaceae bacterium]
MNKPDFEIPNPQTLNALRQQGDPPADELIRHLFENKQAKQLNAAFRQLTLNKDIHLEALPTEIGNFFKQEGEMPTWANEDLLQQGTVFFRKYAAQFSAMLSFLSLPYTYAAANGVKVLYLTGRIHQDTAKRLHETARYLMDITAPEAFAPKGNGIVSSLKVRLMHAAVRYHLNKDKRWDAAWGLPINQEDMIGTNLAFSALPILGLKKMKYHLKQYDMTAYLHLWKVAGQFLGNIPVHLPNRYQEAIVLADKIGERQFQSSREGRALTQALIAFLEKSIVRRFPKDFVTTYMRFLMGDEISKILGIPQYNWSRVLVRPFQTNNILKSLSPTSSREGDKFLKQAGYFLKKDPVNFRIPLTI